jgi:16S rRNA (guanine527-N7)-methyltransferase
MPRHHVSRETPPAPAAPPPPPAAQQAFGPALGRAQRYADILATAGVERGLLGPREVPRIWERHLLNCVVVAPLVPGNASVCDLGSGAGLPGLPIALVRTDVRMTLLEPLQRRVMFLTQCVSGLDLPHVEVVRGRAEEMVGRLAVDVVVARAVAPLQRLVRWSLPLLVPGGQLLALKGASAAGELTAAEPLLRRLGATEWDVRRVGTVLVDPATTVIRIAAGERPPAAVRRAGGRSSSGGSAPRRREG